MKLMRWALAGASAYVVYKYTIGKRATGEKVFAAPEIDGDATATGAKRAAKTD